MGLLSNGALVFLRTAELTGLSSSPLDVLVPLFERYIIQTPSPCDIWDILSLVPNSTTINELINRLVANYDAQSLESKRAYFPRFKACLYQLHRLVSPFTQDSGEHLTSLLVYHVLLLVRDYLRLFIYEGTNRNFADAAQEILRQPSFIQNVDPQRIKYLGDATQADAHQLISFTLLVNWTTDIIVYLLGYIQSQIIPPHLPCQYLFTDATQIQWLRELMIYFYILNKVNRIPCSRISQLQHLTHQQAHGSGDMLKSVYHSLTKYGQFLDGKFYSNG